MRRKRGAEYLPCPNMDGPSFLLESQEEARPCCTHTFTCVYADRGRDAAKKQIDIWMGGPYSARAKWSKILLPKPEGRKDFGTWEKVCMCLVWKDLSLD